MEDVVWVRFSPGPPRRETLNQNQTKKGITMSVDHLLVECQCQGPSVKNTGCPPLEIDAWGKEVWSITIADKSIIITNDDAKRLISRFEAMIFSSEYQAKGK